MKVGGAGARRNNLFCHLVSFSNLIFRLGGRGFVRIPNAAGLFQSEQRLQVLSKAGADLVGITQY